MRHGEDGTDDHRDVVLLEQINCLPSFGGAGENHAHFLLLAEFDGAANVARFERHDEQRLLALDNRPEGFEFQIALEIIGIAFFLRFGVMPRCVE